METLIEGIHEAFLPDAENTDYANETGTAFGWGANCVSNVKFHIFQNNSSKSYVTTHIKVP